MSVGDESSITQGAGNRAQRRAAGRRSKKMMAVSSGAVLVAGVAGPGVVLSQSVASAAVPIVVDSLTDDGTGTTLREAIEEANSAGSQDTITFAAGLSGTISLVSDLPKITFPVDIMGPGADVVKVDGAGNSIFQFYEIASGANSVSGLTLTGGYAAKGDNDDGSGGAINLYSGSAGLDVHDMVITKNKAFDDGGGVHINVSDPVAVTIENTVISGNTADGSGGGLYADFQGGGGSLTITNSQVTGNTAASSGGGLYLAGGVLSVESSTISGNTASGGGGGVYFDSSYALTVRNSTVSGNTAGSYGGGLYLGSSGPVTIENSTFSGNKASQAGGIFDAASGLTIVQSTITDNTATGRGEAVRPLAGGIQMSGPVSPRVAAKRIHSDAKKVDRRARPAVAAAGELELVGTILAGNSGQSLGTDSGAPKVSSDHSILGVVEPAVTVTDLGGTQSGVTDPGLAPLASNGGPTRTHALLATSPALDAGPNPVPSFLGNQYDQRGPGFARVAFGQVDVGAYEAQEPPAPVEPEPGPAAAVEVPPKFTG